MSASPITPEQKARFIRLLRETGSVTVAASAVGYSRATLKRHREQDEVFAADWQEAEDDAADALEVEARRRAVEGVTRRKGLGAGDNFQVIDEQHYSDTLLVRLLEANKPEKFANRSKTEISNPDGSLAPTSDTDLAIKLASLLALAEARKGQG